MRRMRRPALLLAPIALVSAAALAQGSQPISALRGHDADAPVDVTAERLEVQERADRAMFAGNVRVRQAQLTLETERLTVAYSTAGGVQIDRLDASGGVTVRSPSETARGNFGIYDLNRKLITLVGDVLLTRGGSRIAGQRLVIDLNSGRAVVEGGPAGIDQSGGRVTGHFTVPRRSGG